jgi:hypothetical protein
MATPIKTEQDFVDLLLENVAILGTQVEPKYEKTLTPEGAEVYVVVGTQRAITAANLQAMNAVLNSRLVRQHFAEMGKDNMVNTRHELAKEKNLEITDESL